MQGQGGVVSGKSLGETVRFSYHFSLTTSHLLPKKCSSLTFLRLSPDDKPLGPRLRRVVHGISVLVVRHWPGSQRPKSRSDRTDRILYSGLSLRNLGTA